MKTETLINWLETTAQTWHEYDGAILDEIIKRLKELHSMKEAVKEVPSQNQGKYKWGATNNVAIPKTKRKVDELLRSRGK